MDSSPPVLARTRALTRIMGASTMDRVRPSPPSHPPFSSSAFEMLDPPRNNAPPRIVCTRRAPSAPPSSAPHSTFGLPDSQLNDREKLNRAINAVEECPVGLLDCVLNIPIIRHNYQIRKILTVSREGVARYHLLPPLHRFEKRLLRDAPPKTRAVAPDSELPASKRRRPLVDGNICQMMKSAEVIRISDDESEADEGDAEQGTESDATEVAEDDDGEPDAGEAEDEEDVDTSGRASQGTKELLPFNSEHLPPSDSIAHIVVGTTSLDVITEAVCQSRPRGDVPASASTTTVPSPRVRTLDGSAEPERREQTRHASIPEAIDRSLIEVVEMMVEQDKDNKLGKLSWGRMDPEEYQRLNTALQGSNEINARQINVFFSLSEQVADMSVIEALCRQLSLRQTQGASAAGRTDPDPAAMMIAKSGNPMALVKAGAPSTMYNDQHPALALLGCTDLPQLYHRLTSLDQSRWFNSLMARSALCVLAEELDQRLQLVQKESAPGQGNQGKAYMSRAKDQLWDQIFPNQARTDPQHNSERRAFDRRILRGRQWRHFVLRFGWGFLCLIPVDFPDTWLEKNLQQKNLLDAFMDHLARRQPKLSRMCQQGSVLMRALMGGELPPDIPFTPAELLEWLASTEDEDSDCANGR